MFNKKLLGSLLLAVIGSGMGCAYSYKDFDEVEAKITERYQKETNTLKSEIDSLTSRLKEQTELNNALKLEVDALRKKLAELEKRNLELEEYYIKSRPVSESPENKIVKGKINGISSSENRVIVSLGQEQGLSVGMVLQVYRDNQVIGEIRVNMVEPAYAIGESIRVKDLEGFRLGDEVGFQSSKKAP